jgi:DNA repair exonuclease SbcCD nuclease subunit
MASPACAQRDEGADTVRFIHTADLQLGMSRRFLDDDAQARYGQARIDGLTAIGAMAVAEKAEFVVVAGDVFDTNRVRPRTVGRALQAMAAIPVPVFLLPGNHDPLDAATVYRSPIFLGSVPPNVVVLDHSDPIDVRDGVQVVGAPWRTKRPLLDLVGAVCDQLVADPTRLRILVGHGAVDYLGEFHDPSTIRLAAAEAAIADGKVAYIALGDRHSTTRVGETGRIWYAGAPEPTAHDETDAGNVLLVELEDGACTVTPRPIGTWRFDAETVELDAASGPEMLADRLDSLPAKDRSIVRLTLLGVVSLTQYTRIQQIIEEAREVFGSIEEWEPTSRLLVRPEDDDFADLGLSGFAKTAVARLRAEAAGSGPDSGTARDALSVLVQLVHGRGVGA